MIMNYPKPYAILFIKCGQDCSYLLMLDNKKFILVMGNTPANVSILFNGTTVLKHVCIVRQHNPHNT